MNPYQCPEVRQRWNAYHNLLDLRDRAAANDYYAWLHDPSEARRNIMHIEPDYFTPKPSKDIRAEKTRDYRKRRPKSTRYRPDVAVSAGLLFCLLGVSS